MESCTTSSFVLAVLVLQSCPSGIGFMLLYSELTLQSWVGEACCLLGAVLWAAFSWQAGSVRAGEPDSDRLDSLAAPGDSRGVKNELGNSVADSAFGVFGSAGSTGSLPMPASWQCNSESLLSWLATFDLDPGGVLRVSSCGLLPEFEKLPSSRRGSEMPVASGICSTRSSLATGDSLPSCPCSNMQVGWKVAAGCPGSAVAISSLETAGAGLHPS
mmetsp:Transcript_35852/g.101477  ORF Transcript_35852/g.101477 Transcript_35852/m.101477 type:complete len:216 (-) Transcript_35852:265-912(-)